MSSGSLAMMRPRMESNPSSNERLPPLSEAIPEIHQGHSVPDPSQYPRALYESPSGPGGFPGTHHSLAPSPLISSKSRQQFSAAQHSYANNQQYAGAGDSSASSDYSERRGSYTSPASSASLSSASRASPILPLVHSIHTSSRGTSLERNRGDHGGLPPLYAGMQGPPSHQSSFNPAQAYPQSRRGSSPPRNMPYSGYHGMQPQEYSYSMGQYAERPPFNNGSGNGNYPLNFENVGDYSDGKQKKRRGNLPKAVTDILRIWFTEHVAHPYPTEEEKQHLMTATGLTISQISNWFINARRRSLPQMTKQAQAEAELRDNQGASLSMMNQDDLSRNRP